MTARVVRSRASALFTSSVFPRSVVIRHTGIIWNTARAMASASGTRPPKQKKKLVVCCDGTWMDSDLGLQKVDAEQSDSDPLLQTPTNVTRISRSLAQHDADGADQIVYYQAGIGTRNLLDKIIGGASGMGLSENIRSAYHFLASNYNQTAGDEIYLVGFSRGAFTARSIAAFIDAVGLITPQGMNYFYPVFEDWENQLMAGYKSHFPDLPFKGPKPTLGGTEAQRKEYVDKLAAKGYTIPGVKVKAVACFDTVGSLGVPRIGIFDVGRPPTSIDYAFVDTEVPGCVEHAIHALALDESRQPFSPTIWEKPKEPQQTLTQCWFAGTHSDVGGSWPDTRNADITLTWMVSQLSPYLEFNPKQLALQYSGSTTDRPWSCGRINNPWTPAMWLGGTELRHPHDYNKYDHTTGKEMVPKTPLVHTNELIHASVRLRLGLGGLGLDDKGQYQSPALAGWTLNGVQPAPSKSELTLEEIQKGQKGIFWQFGNDKGKTLPEAPMSAVELQLLEAFMPSIKTKFLSTTGKTAPVSQDHKGFVAQVEALFSKV